MAGPSTGNNLTILTTGGVDQTTGIPANALSNNAYPPSTTTGGVYSRYPIRRFRPRAHTPTAPIPRIPDVTTLTNDTISTSAAGAVGLINGPGGATTINGGSITTAGASSLGIQATGAGASITTGLYNGVGIGRQHVRRQRHRRAGGYRREPDARRRIGDGVWIRGHCGFRDRREFAGHGDQRDRLDDG